MIYFTNETAMTCTVCWTSGTVMPTRTHTACGTINIDANNIGFYRAERSPWNLTVQELDTISNKIDEMTGVNNAAG